MFLRQILHLVLILLVTFTSSSWCRGAEEVSSLSEHPHMAHMHHEGMDHDTTPPPCCPSDGHEREVTKKKEGQILQKSPLDLIDTPRVRYTEEGGVIALDTEVGQYYQ